MLNGSDVQLKLVLFIIAYKYKEQQLLMAGDKQLNKFYMNLELAVPSNTTHNFDSIVI